MALTRIRRVAKRSSRVLLPLAVRKRLAIWLNRQRWVPDAGNLSMELLRDLADADPNEFHRFLWSHHLAYAETYEVEQRFRPENLHPTRQLLLRQLQEIVEAHGVRVTSVLDAGSSLGYVLHHIEQHIWPEATRLDGIDIDQYAIAQGSAYLHAAGSRVRLQVADMAALDQVLGETGYDVVLCAGTLMYLRQPDAEAVVDSLLRHTRGVAALTALAHPERDNAELAVSAVRERDGTFIHNLDGMVRRVGGQVLARRWEGPKQLGGNTIYFVYAAPAANPRDRTDPAAMTGHRAALAGHPEEGIP